jgi:hypothetical protein
MNRRDFLHTGVVASLASAATAFSAASGEPQRPRIVDAHCHAGRGLNYGQDESEYAPWTTYNAPEWTLRRMDEAGIDRTEPALLTRPPLKN